MSDRSEKPIYKQHPGDDPVAGEVQPSPLGHRVLPGVTGRALARLEKEQRQASVSG